VSYDEQWAAEARRREPTAAERAAQARRIATSRPQPWRASSPTPTPRRRQRARPPRPWDGPRCPTPRTTVWVLIAMLALSLLSWLSTQVYIGGVWERPADPSVVILRPEAPSEQELRDAYDPTQLPR
jgi:hypothetical protein